MYKIKKETWNNLCVIMVFVTAAQLPVSNYTQPIRTKHKSHQFHQTASESFLKKSEEEKKGNHQHKVTNARSLLLTNLHPLIFLFLFLIPQIQEACGGEADMVVCDAGCGVGGVCRVSLVVLSLCDWTLKALWALFFLL